MMKRYNITVNGKAYDVSVEEIGAGAPAPAAPAAAPAPAAPAAAPAPAPAPAAPAASAGAVKVNAPMPGNILDVRVKKMENEIVAPQDGTVAGVHVKNGDTVNSNDLLVSLN